MVCSCELKGAGRKTKAIRPEAKNRHEKGGKGRIAALKPRQEAPCRTKKIVFSGGG
jgi:hypothetical protein